ncbi:MAG: hypothetical protein WAM53_11510 [Terrimicrobiaceae bacterium]
MQTAALSSARDGDCFLNARQTRLRYGDASDMWLWRRQHDGSGFPLPTIINKRRFWRLSELMAWEKTLKGVE